MTSSASQAGWLPAALVRIPAPRRPAPPARAHGRHSAAEFPVQSVAGELDRVRSGRHAEPAGDRELFDTARDEMDLLDWLGFDTRQD